MNALCIHACLSTYKYTHATVSSRCVPSTSFWDCEKNFGTLQMNNTVEGCNVWTPMAWILEFFFWLIFLFRILLDRWITTKNHKTSLQVVPSRMHVVDGWWQSGRSAANSSCLYEERSPMLIWHIVPGSTQYMASAYPTSRRKHSEHDRSIKTTLDGTEALFFYLKRSKKNHSVAQLTNDIPNAAILPFRSESKCICL